MYQTFENKCPHLSNKKLKILKNVCQNLSKQKYISHFLALRIYYLINFEHIKD